MKELPILFSGEMVRAILEGRKTQTRRVMKPQPTRQITSWTNDVEAGDVVMWRGEPCRLRESNGRNKRAAGELTPVSIVCPYGKPGDRLWVKETFWRDERDPRDVIYAASPEYYCDSKSGKGAERIVELFTNDPIPVEECRRSVESNKFWHKKSPRFMPRWASRITLEITQVRVERVQEISGEDCYAEGIKISCSACSGECYHYDQDRPKFNKRFRQDYRSLWDSINSKRGYGWDKNPWVWVIEFRRIA